MKIHLLLPLAVIPVLAGCGAATQSEILQRSRAEVAVREPWAEQAYIRVVESPRNGAWTWRVKAGAMDYSDYPNYQGPFVVSGTARELCFTRDGCLLNYCRKDSRCIPSPYDQVQPAPAPPYEDSKSSEVK